MLITVILDDEIEKLASRLMGENNSDMADKN
jgi:hypothetical protein